MRKNYDLKSIRRIKRADGLKPKKVYAYTFRALLECAVGRYGKREAYATWGDPDSVVTFEEAGRHARLVGLYLLEHGYRKGDKVILISEGNPGWMQAYLGITSVGLVCVPILPDFSATEVANIISRSRAKGIFTNVRNYEKCCKSGFAGDWFRVEDLFAIPVDFQDGTAKTFASAPGVGLGTYKPGKDWKKEWEESEPEEEDVASLIFTSGTTGSSKGVLLTHKNLVWNGEVNSTQFINPKPGMHVLSILPLSHVYEFSLTQLPVLMCGFFCTFLGRPPAPSVLMKALSDVKPGMLHTVPILIEKVYKSQVGPVLKNKKLRRWLRWRVSRHFICRTAGKKIFLAMGGKMRLFGIGGSKLDPTVERFLRDAHFPYSTGYGLTETSPLIAACSPVSREHHVGYAGRIVEGLDVRIADPDSQGVGEIQVKGPSVMLGYYEDEKLTRESFTSDGYFKTGDLGYKKGKWLSIRGRIKTMILGAAGENIYPEAIENLFNNEPFVNESLVIPSGAGLTALIKLDMESYAKAMQMSLDDAKASAGKYLEGLRKKVNASLSSGSRIDATELQEKPFERTPTQKIKRFLYDRTQRKPEEKDE